VIYESAWVNNPTVVGRRRSRQLDTLGRPSPVLQKEMIVESPAPASPAAGSVSAAHAGGSQVEALVGRHSWCRKLPTIVHP
jgi:hypothetical protein